MARKVILVNVPGIDGAFAVALALHDPELEVLGLAATAGNVSAEEATRNIHVLIEQIDPPRWPRLGAALPADYGMNAVNLHGEGGLGGVQFPCAQLHHPHSSDKLISDLVRQFPHEVSIILMGPELSSRDAGSRFGSCRADRARRLRGRRLRDPGDATAMAEFHFLCDPISARQVLRCGAPVTLLPLDVTRKVVFSPSDLLEMPWPDNEVHQFLRRIVPFGIGATSSLFGVEGLFLHDVLGPMSLSQPGVVSTKPVYADVETRGDLTRGACVVDMRWNCTAKPNIEIATNVDVSAVCKYIQKTLQNIGEET